MDRIGDVWSEYERLLSEGLTKFVRGELSEPSD